MKTHHYIFLSTLLFVVVWYGQTNAGVNLGILGIFYAVLTFLKTPAKNKTKFFLMLLATSIASSLAFAWFGDFPSFLALVSSLLLLSFRSKARQVKSLFIIPVFVMTCLTFFCRFFNFSTWLPKKDTAGWFKKLLAFVVIPFVFVAVFFAVYSAGSNVFAHVFSGYELDFNLLEILGLTALGFFIAFNYYTFTIDRLLYKHHHFLDNDFSEKLPDQKPSLSFLDLDSERTSGVISLVCLNVMLVFFIITYNYEQFYETDKSPYQLSEETHERVNAVIMSIVMAVLVLMFYFKSNFNFDAKAGRLKSLSKIWIMLNAVLVISALLKNWEYIQSFGYTYKRLGVFAFLLLSIGGLVCTYVKIQFRKRNVFLFNTMSWAFYGTILVCSYFNWGGFIAAQNMKRSDFSAHYHFKDTNFSEKQLLQYAKDKNKPKLRSDIFNKIKNVETTKIFSKVLFYETIEK